MNKAAATSAANTAIALSACALFSTIRLAPNR